MSKISVLWNAVIDSIKVKRVKKSKSIPYTEAEFIFDLGDEVKCNVTGFKGIVYSRTCWLYNCNTYSVKAQSLESGKPLSNEEFDEVSLSLISSNTVIPVPLTKQRYNLGDTVRCNLNGFTGVITGIAEWLTGCVNYSLNQEHLDFTGEAISNTWVEGASVSLLYPNEFSPTGYEKFETGGPVDACQPLNRH